jgi:single-strand DNA-binding protein
MLNKFIGIGNLTKDPEFREFSEEKCVCVLSVAINIGKDDKSPLYIDVQYWNNLARNCSKYLSKGRKVFVEGRLSINSWVGKDGTKKQKMFCKGDVINFLNSENRETKPSTKEAESEDLTTEDEELQSVPF